MNALTPLSSQPTATSGLVPQNMDQAMRLAEMMARGKMIPEHLRNPSDALMVIEQAMRWNMSPFAVAQCTSSIKGKLMFEGKLIQAAVENSGAIVGLIDYSYAGSGPDRTVTVSAVRRSETTPRTVEVRLKDAITDNGIWKKQPDQQLAYHGARVWARRWTPGVILGVYSPEEMDPPPHREPPHDGPTLDAVAEPAQVALDADPQPDRQADATDRLIARIQACQTEDALHAISGDVKIADWRTKIGKTRPELEARIAEAFGATYQTLVVAGQNAQPKPVPPADAPVPSDEVPF